MHKHAMIMLVYILIIFSGNARAVNYYISSAGNDSNDGLSQATPWLSITKVNSMMNTFNPGDQILFRKGDTFFGTILVTRSGAAGNEIVFGSYGTGNLPVISGKKAVTGWTVYSGNIYKATVTDTVGFVYINGKIMTLARYPNSGFLRVDAGNGANGFYDAALGQSAGYWNGANVRVRTINWAYETRTVANFSGGNISYSSPTQYQVATNFGYYLDNKLNQLDAQNEWYFDKSTFTLYLYAPGGVNPNSITVEAFMQRNGINANLNVSYIKIQDLKFIGARDVAVFMYGSSYVTITGCQFNFASRSAITLNGTGSKIENNFFEDSFNAAIAGVNSNLLVKNNTINRTGLIPGYGENALGYSGIMGNTFTGSTIEGNNIDSSGYSGMLVGGNALVKNNVVNYSMMTLNDGGGIDVVTTSNGLQILNNIVGYTIGNSQSSATSALYGTGLYINGAMMTNCVISGNTFHTNTYSGMLYDHKNGTDGNLVSQNTFYNNFVSGIIFSDYSAVNFVPSYNCNIKNNIFYALQSGQDCMKHMMFNSPNMSDYGNFDSNYYCNPYSEYVIRRTINNPWSNLTYNLSTWQSTFNEDPNSKTSVFQFEQYGVTDTLSANLISNSEFNTDVNGWSTWPQGASIGHVVHPKLDGGSMWMRWNGIGASLSLDMSNPFPVTRGYYYIASLSIVGDNSGTFTLWGRSSHRTNPSFFPWTSFSYDTSRNDYSMIFKADTTDNAARLCLSLTLPDSLIYADNIRMYRISIDPIDSTQKSKLFLNETGANKYFSFNGITYKDLDGNPVTGGINLAPYSSRILINENFIPTRTLSLRYLVEGFYDAASDKMIPDSSKIYLRSYASPYNFVDSSIALLDSNGVAVSSFFNAVNNSSYYLVAKHRNSMEVWSKYAVTFVSNQLNYDYTTASTKAYGDNLFLKGTKYCTYSGDENSDGNIDITDVVNVFNSANSFQTGYVNEDIDGDQSVDISDINIAFNNSFKFISLIRP